MTNPSPTTQRRLRYPAAITIAGLLMASGATAVWAAAKAPVEQPKTELTISGSFTQPFSPGVEQPVNLVLSNPNSFDVYATVTVSVDDATRLGGQPNAACSGTANLTVVQDLVGSVNIRKNATKSLEQLGVATSRWPRVRMPNLPSDQSACKGTTFRITYTGTAIKK